MFGLLDIPKMLGPALIGAALVGAWAVLSYGPAQYEAGGLNKAAELDRATTIAAKELTNEADRRRFLYRQCVASGRMFQFDTGGCVERPSE